MKLLRFDRMEDVDFPKLMEIYRESNLENIPYFFPEETDRERGLRRVEAGFRDYLQNDFFAESGNRLYVLADEARWCAAIRLSPLSEPGNWYAEALETAPALRRRGYARKLLELLCRALAEEGPFALRDSVGKRNEPSLAFHRAAGFTVWQENAVDPFSGETDARARGLCYSFGGWPAQRIEPIRLSARYQVRRLETGDLPALLRLCRGNPQFYRHYPPEPSEESLLADLAALPPRKTLNDKYYLGFWEGKRLCAVLDLISGFPRPEIAFWGFFMLEAALQGKGRGTALVTELCAALRELGFRSVRLGWAEGNPQAEHFWKKNGFTETGVRYDAGGCTVVVAQRELT